MKFTGIFYLIITTVVLLTLVVMVYYNLPFSLVFFVTLGGQLLLIFTVYKVLTDDYTTDKTFEDWYEDHPIGKE
ncbi:MAG TPA: hypothetical protein VLN46_06875 [Gillisia sp.]|nr:hypothetical protein [Gillisia sp.]